MIMKVQILRKNLHLLKMSSLSSIDIELYIYQNQTYSATQNDSMSVYLPGLRENNAFNKKYTSNVHNCILDFSTFKSQRLIIR